jgi:hypothetical protein
MEHEEEETKQGQATTDTESAQSILFICGLCSASTLTGKYDAVL